MTVNVTRNGDTDMSMGDVGKELWPVHWLSEGWSTLREQAHSAITHFKHVDEGETEDEPPTAQRWGVVAVDVVDHDDILQVRMEVPGVAKEDLQVEISAGQLTVTGEKRVESSRKDGNAIITERAFGQFCRVLPLPVDVETDNASASYADGILAIDLQKQANPSRRQIDIG